MRRQNSRHPSRSFSPVPLKDNLCHNILLGLKNLSYLLESDNDRIRERRKMIEREKGRKREETRQRRKEREREREGEREREREKEKEGK